MGRCVRPTGFMTISYIHFDCYPVGQENLGRGINPDIKFIWSTSYEIDARLINIDARLMTTLMSEQALFCCHINIVTSFRHQAISFGQQGKNCK